jgi:dihydroorotate dehydrogenase (fumarate)
VGYSSLTRDETRRYVKERIHILDGIGDWMEEQGFETVEELRGRVSALAVPNPAEFERANYVNILDSYSFSRGALV